MEKNFGNTDSRGKGGKSKKEWNRSNFWWEERIAKTTGTQGFEIIEGDFRIVKNKKMTLTLQTLQVS